ncbi:HAMP domain-containing histidine kinase [Corynebacterium sp. 35RC1]|nr:HAMP domain-containing histidine kinase [Corynebacterium sp. 35RC1]
MSLRNSQRFARVRSKLSFRLSAMPLTAGLLIIVFFVSAFGVLLSSYAVYKTMENFTYARIDEELHRGLDGWARQDSIFLADQGIGSRPPTDFYVAKIFPDGSMVVYNDNEASPDLTQLYIGDPQEIGSEGDSLQQWRALAHSSNNVITVVAKNTTEESNTLHRTAYGQMVIGVLYLVVIAVLSFFLIRRALRPLREVERTARTIAEGNLDARVPEAPAHTEVGAVANSMNVMMERLQGSIVELQAKEEQMRRFVGDASHELRTPLTSVKGYAELYSSGATNDADKVISKIQEEAQRMSLLVEDLLALTRAEGARFEEAPVDLLETVLAVTTSLRGAFPDREISVASEYSGVPVVCGDASRLHQVFTNLTVNALKHAGPDAQVKVLLRNGDNPDANTVVVDVIDNGVGIAAEDASHIFERFYRTDASRTRATGGGGSGLGLAIVKSLVESHGGQVSVRSELGQGTTFSVELPAYPQNPGAGSVGATTESEAP